VEDPPPLQGTERLIVAAVVAQNERSEVQKMSTPESTESSAAEAEFRANLDREYIFDFAQRLSQIGSFELGFKPAGTPAAHRAAELIAEEMRAIGLQGVAKEPFPVHVWDFSGARLEVEGWEPIPACAFPPTPGTPPGGLARNLVNVGRGTAKDYIGVDVRDQIAFIGYDAERLPWVGSMAYEAELHGAAGLVFYYLNSYAQHESGDALNVHNGTARETIPILQIPLRHGKRIAARFDAGGALPATLHSAVEVNPKGTGYNVLGRIPGRLDDRYILIGAHYDVWFTGYWDNAVGVGAILAMAKALLDSGHQPQHTLIFISTDAEESGAADTQFDWLIGCMNLLGAHPEWSRAVTAAFNIDTLSPVGSQQMGFISSPELLPFVRSAAESYDISSFPVKEPQVEPRVTAWTETLAHAYFGIPPLQPRFRLEELREAIYHSQFDQAAVVDRDKGAETVAIYGSMLARLDQAAIPPYSLRARVEALRGTIAESPDEGASEEIEALTNSLQRLLAAGDAFDREVESLGRAVSEGEMDTAADRLRSAVSFLTRHLNFLDGAEAEDAHPLHVYYARDLRALDAAIAQLASEHGEEALATLRDPEHGLRGASWAPEMSYPTWYRHTCGGSNQGRSDLFWGKDRTARVTDAWAILTSLQDKLDRGIWDFGAEIHTLRRERAEVRRDYRESLRMLTGVIHQAADLLSQSGALSKASRGEGGSR
jgi:hypothetical protein